jgi:SAM-dependent methyltransferase
VSPKQKINKKPMPLEKLKAKIEVTDAEFDQVFTKKIQKFAAVHFTPVAVAKAAAEYLTEKKGQKILDIGSGAGKFCLVAAALTEGYFTGIEQRRSLFLLSKRIAKRFKVENVQFLHGNITDISLANYDGFYFYNAFFENVSQTESLSPEFELSIELYRKYSFFVRNQLDSLAIGTKIVTYFSFLKELPESFELEKTDFDGNLKFWKKTS